MYELFKAKATAVGAEVHRVRTRRDALDFIIPFLKKEGLADAPGSYALWADCPFLQGMDKSELQQSAGLSFEVSRSRAAQAKFGISQMEWALADTGSLVQDQGAVEQRLVSSLTGIHIALISPDNILGRKSELFAKINPQTSRYIAFITGPSRTADIERVLTIGVHGPERLIIVFVDELGGEKR
jgi:L-lactate dehydrogenase complex protein LldG